MSLDDFGSLDSPLSQRDTLPADLPNLRASAERLANTYSFCQRCWMPTAPVRRCRCAPEPYPEDATPARVVAEHPQVKQLAAAVAAGRYADDTATREQRWLEWLLWLQAHGKIVEPPADAPTSDEAVME